MFKILKNNFLVIRQDFIIIILFTLLYTPYVAHSSLTRAFWLDELFTYYIVTMPDWAGMFDLIRRGPDQNPPIFYVLSRFVVGFLGEEEWVFRLPAMVGYWVFCVALYSWVRLLGGGRAAALAALATPLLTAAIYYASEARPYGLVMGCLGLSLIGWRITYSPHWRGWGLTGLSAGLCLAAALHYLALPPIGALWASEGVLTWRTRHFNRARWMAMGAPLLVLPLHLPFFYQQAQQGFWKITLAWSELSDFYRWLIATPPYLGLCGIIILFKIWNWLSASTPCTPNPSQKSPNNACDSKNIVWLITSVSFLLLPVFWMLLLKATRQTAFQDRYFLSALIGLGGLAAYGLRSLSERLTPLASIAMWCLISVPVVSAVMQPWRLVPPSVAEIIALPKEDYPIVVSDQLYFFPIRHYYPGRFEELVYVVTKQHPPRSTGGGVWALQRHPRAPDWLDENEFFSRWAGDFYFVCHKTYMRHWFDEFRRRGYPVVRETPNYVVYEWRRKQ